MKTLRRTQFGNQILRKTAKRLSMDEIESDDTQHLIDRMFYTLEQKKYGVGLAAPQVNRSIALSVIGTKPTPTRPDRKEVQLTLINPEIIEYYGEPVGMYEACISGELMYAEVPRHEDIRLKWTDREGRKQEKDLDGFIAHVAQHEVDHLNGRLYVDRVVDTTTYKTRREYEKYVENLKHDQSTGVEPS